MRRLSIWILSFSALLLVLIYYNYTVVQKTVGEQRETQLIIELVEAPSTLEARQRGRFVWKVDAPESFSTRKTGIYWSYDSTPSGLMKSDPPEVVNYSNFTEDYASGLFRLPDVFDLDIAFERKAIVYFRAYAKIDENHLWTKEGQVEIK